MTGVKNPLIRVAVGGASGVFVYLLGGGRVASFLTGVIVSVFLDVMTRSTRNTKCPNRNVHHGIRSLEETYRSRLTI